MVFFRAEIACFRAEIVRFCAEIACFPAEIACFRTEIARFRAEKARFPTEIACFRAEKARFPAEITRFRAEKARFQRGSNPSSHIVRIFNSAIKCIRNFSEEGRQTIRRLPEISVFYSQSMRFFSQTCVCLHLYPFFIKK
ncbi:MAG: hypothetical protein LBS04_03080 [Tannerellaceae bacterium]|jgi:uncharacterized small protein (DUF1192 family)|nr:hypothetical protein [Tannerellaceae bacterium]